MLKINGIINSIKSHFLSTTVKYIIKISIIMYIETFDATPIIGSENSIFIYTYIAC